MKRRIGCLVFGWMLFVLSLAAQTPRSSPASAQVPPLIQFSSVATDDGGNTLSGVVNLTFSLYAAQQGGEPLWTETQNNVPLDPTGHYSRTTWDHQAEWRAHDSVHCGGSALAGSADRGAIGTASGATVKRALCLEGRGRGDNRGIAALGFRTGGSGDGFVRLRGNCFRGIGRVLG
jgi:hypothetical protein